jgi:hypothetical protein
MGKLVQEIVDSIPLPYPHNLPEKEKIAALRAMTPAERLAIGFALSDEYRRRWLTWLRRQFPAATEQDFRMIVLGRLLEDGEEERRIAARAAERAKHRTNHSE